MVVDWIWQWESIMDRPTPGPIGLNSRVPSIGYLWMWALQPQEIYIINQEQLPSG